MWDPGRGGLRTVRSAIVGLIVALVATASHVAGGGTHASWIAIIPAGIAVALVVAAIGARPVRRLELILLLGLAQVGVHGLSSYLHGLAPWHDAAMLTAHLAGVALTALALARGEDLMWRLHAWLLPRLLPRTPAGPTPTQPVFIAPPRRSRIPFLVLGAVGRRGPPVAAAHA